MLPGQVQAVSQGAGTNIAGNGQISVDAATTEGLVKLNNTIAFNSYVWPSADGSAGQQLTTDGSGALVWSDSDGIPWTAKGQIIVGTNVATDVLLNVGGNTAVLVANSATPSGLAYSDSVTSAIQIPAGTTLEQPSVPSVGQIRYNTQTSKFEGYWGSPPSWQDFGSRIPWTAKGELIVGTGVDTDVILTAGGDTTVLIANSAAPSGLAYSDSVTSAIQIPAGTTLDQPIAPSVGQFRYNTQTHKFEGYWGSPPSWQDLVGGIPWTTKGQLIVGTGVDTEAILDAGGDTAVLVSDSASSFGLSYSDSITSAVQLPAGKTSEQPSSSSVGQIRYNTDNLVFEGYQGNPASWQPIGVQAIPSGSVMAFFQASAPVGWTQSTNPAFNNSTMRITTGAGGSVGGSIGFSTVFGASTTQNSIFNFTSGATQGTQLVTNQIPSHAHGVSDPGHAHGVSDPTHFHRLPYNANTLVSGQTNAIGGVATGPNNAPTLYSATGIGIFGSATGISVTNTGGDGAHDHSLSGVSGGLSLTTTDMDVLYYDAIICTKN